MVESAIAIRVGFNADGKEFQKWLEQYSNEDPEEKEKREIGRSYAAMEKFFGGK